MRILYVSQYFPPEMGAPSARVYELAREWVSLGHEVTVLTAFPHHPTGIKLPGDRGVLTRRETKDGIDVVRTYVFAAPNQGTFKRFLSYASFMASASVIGPWRIKRPDVVIATSPQLLCGVAGFALAKTFRSKFVFEVRDLWPESIIAVDAMRENTAIRLLRRVADFLYRKSDRIVTVGEGYLRGITANYDIDPSKIDVIPNGIDTRLFTPRSHDDELQVPFERRGKFIMSYIGTHGMAHHLSFVLEAAKRLRNDPEKHFVFVGEGAEKERLKQFSAEERLPNVTFIDQQPRERLPDFYAAGHVGLVTLRNTPLFQEVLPSKIFEYFAMERPVLTTVGGEAQRLIEAAGGGEFVPPDDLDQFVAAISRLAGDPARLAAMGKSARAHVTQYFDRGVLARNYLDVLARLIHVRRSASVYN